MRTAITCVLCLHPKLYSLLIYFMFHNHVTEIHWILKPLFRKKYFFDLLQIWTGWLALSTYLFYSHDLSTIPFRRRRVSFDRKRVCVFFSVAVRSHRLWFFCNRSLSVRKVRFSCKQRYVMCPAKAQVCTKILVYVLAFI